MLCQAGVGQECSAPWKEQPRSARPLGLLSVPLQWHGSATAAPAQICSEPGRKGAPTEIKHQGRRPSWPVLVLGFGSIPLVGSELRGFGSLFFSYSVRVVQTCRGPHTAMALRQSAELLSVFAELFSDAVFLSFSTEAGVPPLNKRLSESTLFLLSTALVWPCQGTAVPLCTSSLQPGWALCSCCCFRLPEGSGNPAQG